MQISKHFKKGLVMQIALRKDALTETFLDIENLIYKVVWDFKDHYGGDFEQLLAEANLLFVLAYDTHNEAKAGFTTWLHFCIRKGLLSFKRRIRQENKYTKFFPLEETNPTHEKFYQPLCFFELFDEFGADSKQIIELILNPPTELVGLVFEEGKYNPHTFKAELRTYLSSLGWTGRRIKESFNEIREVISNNG